MKENHAVQVKNMTIDKKTKKSIKKFAHMTKIMLCPYTKNHKLRATKHNMKHVTGKNFFKLVAERFQVNVHFVKNNHYKVMSYLKDNGITICINAYDSKKEQKFYLAHMIGLLMQNWSFYPDKNGHWSLPKENLQAVKSSNGMMEVCGDIRFYNDPTNELYANYYAEQLLGYDLY